MVRIATVNDAAQLEILNILFNGESETTLENIRDSLSNNPQEIVIVDEADGLLAGFVCVQLKRSFCYAEYTPEITEVYVRPQYRRKGIARAMLTFAEEYCGKKYPLHKFELLTGRKNAAAQALYRSLGYVEDGELHLVKRMEVCDTWK